MKLSTHSSGGITDKDFALARQIEDAVLWRPGRRQPAGGHAEQVRLQQVDPRVSERLLFVTGKLAAPALRDTLGRAELPFDYDIAVMKITVAALMTTDWIARFLEVARGRSRGS